MVYSLGPLNFVDYVKASGRNGFHDKGLLTTEYLSNYFDFNFYYALKSFAPYLKDRPNFEKAVPENISSLSKEQKAVLNRIKSKMGFDFVGNLYACGAYLYKPSKNAFEYTSDTAPAFEIPAGGSYTFDFNKVITSVNPKFKFKEIKVSDKSKLGGTLTFDANDKKKLVYTANPESYDQIDEFDIDVIPEKFEGRPDNYVPSYKFKIKVRNVVNKPTLYIYDQLPAGVKPRGASDLPKLIQDNNLEASLIKIPDETNGRINYIRKERQYVESRFKFVAPKTGKYTFMSKHDDFMIVKVNGKAISEKNKYNLSFENMGSYDFEEGKIYDITLGIYNEGGGGSFDTYLDLNGQKYSIYENSLSDLLDVANLSKEQIDKFLKDPVYKYKQRFKPEDPRFDIEFAKLIWSKQPVFKATVVELSKYKPINPDKNLAATVDNNTNTYLETWSTNEVKFKVNFDKAITTDTLKIVPRKDNHGSYVPNFIKLIAVDENNNQKVVFEGKTWNNQLWFNPTSAKSFIVEAKRVDGKGTGLVFAELQFGVSALKQNTIIPLVNHSSIDTSGSWEWLNNDSTEAFSPVNGVSIKSKRKNDTLTFEVSDVNFTIYGKTSTESKTLFDVYVDDQLVAENVSTKAIANSYSAPLFAYFDFSKPNNTKHKVKIVNKTNEPLILTYFSTKN